MSAFPLFDRLARRIAQSRERARIARQLDGMNDHDLRDIGIARAEIDRIAAGSVRHSVR